MSSGQDRLSESLINFKKAHPLHVAAWNECSLLELAGMALTENCGILRALNSEEESVILDGATPMDKLGRMIAEQFNGRYEPNLLSKLRQTAKVKYLTRVEREQELLDVYQFIQPAEVFYEILIIDDILTTATTIREVIKSIRSVLPKSRIRIFTLASADRQALLNSNIRLGSLSYTWFPDKGWNVVTEGAAYYESLNRLKSQILADRFDDE